MDAVPASATKELREGRYVLLAPLGQGAQGVTWDAVDKREGRAVAVKAFDVRGARTWKDVELAEREARVLAKLHHRSLPRYIEHFEQDGVLYLVMEKILGTPLSVMQKAAPRMSERDLRRFLRDADDALTYLHGQSPPVIHRDLKPSNVIQRDDGSYAFVDFGAVRDRLRPEGGSTVVGTFGYMAPEQFQGRAGPASDVYSIGATAIALLTGQEPEKLPHRGLSLDVDAALGKTASPWVRDVLTRMLEPDPDRRATRIGPLLREGPGDARSSASPKPGRDDPASARAWRDAVDSAVHSSREARRAVRRAAKRARKEARREARRAGGWHPHHGLPFGLRVLFSIGLTVAQVAVLLALQVAVPLLLTVLSLVFGSGLRRAAEQVRLAGGEVGRTLGQARGEIQRGWQQADVDGAEQDGQVHVAGRVETTSGGPRVRVDAPSRTVPGAAGIDVAGDLESGGDVEDVADARRPARTRR